MKKKRKLKKKRVFSLVIILIIIGFGIYFIVTKESPVNVFKESLKTIQFEEYDKKISKVFNEILLDSSNDKQIDEFIKDIKKYDTKIKSVGIDCLDSRRKIIEYFNEDYNQETSIELIKNSYNICSEYESVTNFNKDQMFIIGAILEEKSEISNDEILLTFIGDTSFGTFHQAEEKDKFDAVWQRNGSDKDWVFKYTKQWFSLDDLTIVNSEAAFTNETKHENKLWIIPSKPEHAVFYSLSNIEVANLANNHTKDYFTKGYEDTKNAMKNNGIEYFDDGIQLSKTIKNKEIVFLGYDCRMSQQNASYIARIEKEIKNAKKNDNLVIVNMHWGLEYQQPVSYQKEYAHRIIDAGADLIIGAHSHMLQGIEYYKNKYIIYSMGDFAFGGDPYQESRDTAIFRVYYNIKENTYRLKLVPCYENSDGVIGLNNFQPLPVYGDNAKKIMDHMINISKLLNYGIKSINYYNIEW